MAKPGDHQGWDWPSLTQITGSSETTSRHDANCIATGGTRGCYNGSWASWQHYLDSKVHGANMGPTWVLSAPDGPHVGPLNLAIRVGFQWLSYRVNLLSSLVFGEQLGLSSLRLHRLIGIATPIVDDCLRFIIVVLVQSSAIIMLYNLSRYYIHHSDDNGRTLVKRQTRWIPRTKASDAQLWSLLWSTPEWMVE